VLRVKICGVTSADSAREAARLGADAVGLVFHADSPRALEPDAACEVVRALPPWVARVGVFTDHAPAKIRELVQRVGLTAVQLHGDHSTEEVRELSLAWPVVVGVSMSGPWEERVRRFREYPLLLDSSGPETPGGTGRTWDWARFDPDLRPRYLILAGGLDPDNVADAVRRLRPDAVDVSSGVESRPGQKSNEKMRAFMRAVASFRTADGD
jgi:phosphoribosylanthranilate isomerase